MLEIVKLQHDAAAKELNTFEAMHQRLATAFAEQARLHKAVVDSKLEITKLQSFENEAREKYQSASSLLDSYRSELQLAHKRQTSFQATTRVKELGEKLVQAKKYRSEIEDLSAKLAANKATPQWLRNVEQANAELVRLTAAKLAQASQMTVSYIADVRISLDDSPIPGNVPISLPKHALLDLPGIGQLQIDAGSGKETLDLDTAVVDASQKLVQLLSICGANVFADANELVRLRQETIDSEKLSKSSLSIVAPQGIEELQRSLAEAETLTVDFGADEGSIRSPDELAPLISEAQKSVNGLQIKLSKAQILHANARENQIKLTTQHEASVQELNAAEHSAGPLQEREERRLKAAGQVTQLRLKQGESQQAVDGLMAIAPDLATVKANLIRAKGVIDTVNSQLKKLGQDRAALSATIEAQAAGGIEERRNEIAGQLGTA